MKKFFLILSIFSFSLVSFSLDLKQVINSALKNNKELSAKNKDVIKAKLDYYIAKSSKLPKFELKAVYKNFEDPHMLGYLSYRGQIPDFAKEQAEYYVSFSMPLYTGGKVENYVKITDYAKKISENDFKMSKNELIKNIVSVYSKIIELKKLVNSVDIHIKSLNKKLKDVQELVRVGKAINVDALKVKVKLGELKEMKLSLENNIRILKLTLENLAGKKLDFSDFRPEIKIKEKKFEKFNLKNNLKIKMLEDKLKIASLKVGIERAKNKPSLVINGNYGGMSDFPIDTIDNNYITVAMQYDLYDFKSKENSVKKARADREKQKLLFEDACQKLKIAFEKEKLALKELNEKIKTYKLNVKMAKETYKIESLNYDAGKNTMNDVLDAQALLLSSEANLYDAEFNKINKIMELYDLQGENLEKVFIY